MRSPRDNSSSKQTKYDRSPSPLLPTSKKKYQTSKGSDKSKKDVPQEAAYGDDIDFKDSAIHSDEEEKITEETVKEAELATSKVKQDCWDIIN